MSRSRRLFAAVLSATFVVLGAAVGASAQEPPPDPGVGIRLLEAPEDRRDDPRARRYVIDHVAPGQKLSRAVEVSNGTGAPTRIELFSAAATVKDDSFVPAGGREQNEASEWINVDPPVLELDAGARARAEMTITVPSDARAGERYAVVLAELPPAAEPGNPVAVVSRAGIRVYLSVGSGGEPPTSFRLDTFEPRLDDSGVPQVVVETCNTGGRALDVTGEIRLDDGPGGTSAGPFATGRATTLGTEACGSVLIPLKKGLPKGPWRASVALRSGRQEEQATATITFPDQAGSAAAPVKAEPREVTGTSKGRWALLLALLLLLLVLLLLATWLRHRQKKKQREAAEQQRGDGSAP